MKQSDVLFNSSFFFLLCLLLSHRSLFILHLVEPSSEHSGWCFSLGHNQVERRSFFSRHLFFLESLLAVLKLCHLIGPGPDLNCQKLRFHMHTGKEESFNIMQERGRRAACNEPVRR